MQSEYKNQVGTFVINFTDILAQKWTHSNCNLALETRKCNNISAISQYYNKNRIRYGNRYWCITEVYCVFTHFAAWSSTWLATTEVNNSQSHGTVVLSAMWCLQSENSFNLWIQIWKAERGIGREPVKDRLIIEIGKATNDTLLLTLIHLVPSPLCPHQ